MPAPADPYRAIEQQELARAGNNLSEHFESVLILVTATRGGQTFWGVVNKGNTFANRDIACKWLDEELPMPSYTAPPDFPDDDGEEDGDGTDEFIFI